MNVIEKLIEKNMTISTMESCTSGSLASAITDVSGASAIFPGGLVTYSNAEKVKAGVPEYVISGYGVYSQETAIEMAKTVRNTYQTDIGIGVTGTLGRLDPNNQDSELGVIHYAIVNRDIKLVASFHLDDLLRFNRKEQKEIIVQEILKHLGNFLDELEK